MLYEVITEQPLEARRVERRAVVMALPLLAAERAQPLELGGGLDALGRDREAEAVRHCRDRLHDLRVRGMRIELAQERAVDLQLVDRQAAQVSETRIAGAEVVDRDAYAERCDPAQRIDA